MDKTAAIEYWRCEAHEVFVAEENGKIVGTYFCKRINKAVVTRRQLRLHDCCECDGRGVARAMCEHSLGRARSRRFRAMQYISSSAPTTAPSASGKVSNLQSSAHFRKPSFIQRWLRRRLHHVPRSLARFRYCARLCYTCCMPDFAPPVERLIDELKHLPGIWPETAQRLAF